MTGSRLQHVDAMRAIAVLLVVWTHYAEAFANFSGSQLFLNDIQRSVNFGRIGVVIFFAISGFLIPSSLKGEKLPGTRRFIIRRFFRLYPAYWVSLPLGYTAVWWLNDRSLPASDIVAGFSMVQGVLGFEHIMGHYWTLETELFFYFGCLVLFWTGTIRKFGTIAGMSAVLGLAFCVVSAFHIVPDNWHGAYKGLLFHLSIMFWGACVRCAYDGLTSRKENAGLIALTGFLLLLGMAIFTKGVLASEHSHIASGLAYMVGLLAFLFFLTCWKIHNGVASWLGKISYSLYLLHPVSLYVVSWICTSYGLTGWPLGLYTVAALMPALLLGWISYEAIERTGIMVSDRLTERSKQMQVVPAI
ncbi:acyltransferase [Brucella abortus]|uniref:acyltransferase family protein n=1 Tax=Brucella abortus TaxID=235 RepID=UPI000F8E43AC|nr:acyltransferase [Brucella abortus]RUQ67026.1 acyltransferase [Brucella abortus]RUQ78329.1 acyltransferase [Brucella abortus]RUQ88132.1 acyltransferase [Brucella abortus]RUQ96362.1 acyltransferase [Brucella abortus]RUR05962.1 acyltransferase [Brucella abortus]